MKSLKIAFVCMALAAAGSAQALDSLGGNGRSCDKGDSRCASPMGWLPMGNLFGAFQRGMAVADAPVESKPAAKTAKRARAEVAQNTAPVFMPFGLSPCVTR